MNDVMLPQSDAMVARARKLDELSRYPCLFDYGSYQKLELRSQRETIRGGITFNNPFRIVNAHPTCQQCLYSFELDTYGRGCFHNCAYCYAKAQLQVHGWWNKPTPVPIDINDVRETFYEIFETSKSHRLRSIMEKRIPLRIGSMSDSFMNIDLQYRVTQELIKILNYYRYPHVIFTHSDLVGKSPYVDSIDPDLCSVQVSMASINDNLNRLIEPGAPSAVKRLKALQALCERKIWTTVRVNPLFPWHPDGYYSKNFDANDGDVPHFDYSSLDIVDAVAEHGVPSLLVGFGRFSSFSLNRIKEATGFDLRTFFDPAQKKSARDFHYSAAEIFAYYRLFKARCDKLNVDFSVCYIGNGEGHFWESRKLWSNKADCCNIKGVVPSFVTDSRAIPFDARLKHSHQKSLVSISSELYTPLDPVVTPN